MNITLPDEDYYQALKNFFGYTRENILASCQWQVQNYMEPLRGPADDRDRESGDSISALEKRGLKYELAIRSNHEAWLPPGQGVRHTNWRPFERIFSNGEQQTHYIQEIIFGQRGRIRLNPSLASERYRKSQWSEPGEGPEDACFRKEQGKRQHLSQASRFYSFSFPSQKSVFFRFSNSYSNRAISPKCS